MSFWNHEVGGAARGDTTARWPGGILLQRRTGRVFNAGNPAWRLAFVLLTVGTLGIVACGNDAGANSESVIVGRVAEWFVPGTARAWVPIEPEDISEGLVSVLSRFRITVRDPLDSPVTYDVLVSAACFAALRVGDPWPAPPAACR